MVFGLSWRLKLGLEIDPEETFQPSSPHSSPVLTNLLFSLRAGLQPSICSCLFFCYIPFPSVVLTATGPSPAPHVTSFFLLLSLCNSFCPFETWDAGCVSLLLPVLGSTCVVFSLLITRVRVASSAGLLVYLGNSLPNLSAPSFTIPGRWAGANQNLDHTYCVTHFPPVRHRGFSSFMEEIKAIRHTPQHPSLTALTCLPSVRRKRFHSLTRRLKL